MEASQSRRERSQLLNYLWEIQNKDGFISDAAVRKLAGELNISGIELEGVISFYHFFHRKPIGKYTIYLNNSIVSDLKGYEKVKQAFEQATGGKFDGVDPTLTFGLFETPCIGLSDQEPAALINFRPFTNLNPDKVFDIIEKLRAKADIDELKDDVPDNIQHVPKDKTVCFRDYEMGAAVKKMLDLSPEEVIGKIKESGLSGRGGAFFPTGLKWDFCRKNEGYQKYVVCNADEGEPGTFKDRVLISALPGLMIEGMIIGGYAVGANQGIIYLRAEYSYLREGLQKEIDKFYKMGLLGENILGREDVDFDLRIQMGAGSYVCGEETALLESLEGKRGEPRVKMYFPVEKGFLNKPTIVNNVETFSVAARVIELGPEVWRGIGTEKTPGTKVFSISGDVRKPGIYELEWGVTLREIMDLCEADDPYFIQLSGPSGKVLSAEDLDRRICGEDLLCEGSVMIFNKEMNIFRILKNFSDFFIHESCGICTPCRAGNFILGRKLDRLRRGLASDSEIDEIRKWGSIIKDASRCGLGKTAPNSLLEAIDKFPDEFNDLVDADIDKAKDFDMEEAVVDYMHSINELNKV